MSATFSIDTANEPSPEPFKLPQKREGRVQPFPDMAKWVALGNAVEDFPADSEFDLEWPKEVAADMHAIRTAEQDVDDEFWDKHT